MPFFICPTLVNKFSVHFICMEEPNGRNLFFNLLQASEELEERESLAQMAANEQESHTDDGDTYIG